MSTTTERGRTVAVVGLEAIGMGMAQRLATARDAVASADAVVLAVCDTRQRHDVLLGNNGVAASLEPGAVVVLTSNVGVDGIRATITSSSRTQASSVTLPGRRVYVRPPPQPLRSCSSWVWPRALAPLTTPPSYGSWRRSAAPGRTSSHHRHHSEETP